MRRIRGSRSTADARKAANRLAGVHAAHRRRPATPPRATEERAAAASGNAWLPTRAPRASLRTTHWAPLSAPRPAYRDNACLALGGRRFARCAALLRNLTAGRLERVGSRHLRIGAVQAVGLAARATR